METYTLKNNIVFSVIAAFLVGILQMYLLNFFWSYVMLSSPLPIWLIEQGLRGVAFSTFFFFFDLLINVTLCLPAGYVICKLRPKHLLIYLSFAVIPYFLFQYRLFFLDTTLFQNWQAFLPGAISALLMLPLSVLVITYIQRKGAAPNYAIKGTSV